MLNDHGTDFTLAFRRLGDGTARGLFEEPAAFDAWAGRWRDAHRGGAAGRGDAARGHARGQPALHSAQPSRRSRPVGARSSDGDYGPFDELLAVLAQPYEERPEFAAYAEPPERRRARNFRTFCGT